MKKRAMICVIVLFIAVTYYIVSEQLDKNTAHRTSVSILSEKTLVPGGHSIGVKMDVKGVLVVGLEEIENANGEKINPGILSGVQIGDTIISINGKDVYKAEDVEKIVNEECETVTLKIKRNDEIMSIDVAPVPSEVDGRYKLGMWIKDKTAGIGTLTFYDPNNACFGALGHGITDPETNSVLPVETGLLLEAQVKEVEEADNDIPGEIRGVFYHTDTPLGNLERNCEYGVFGTAYHPIENPLYSKPLAIGSRKQIEVGDAYILTTLKNNKIERYDVKIEKIYDQSSQSDKSMVIRVTDEDLINESGGIVQGMSGSPIIQNNRIVGAVTHVFLNDPTRGYGVFIEWMLKEEKAVEK